VNALKALTDGQKSHIDTYKEMVNIKAIQEVFDLQKKEIAKQSAEYAHGKLEELILPPIKEELGELYRFLAHFFFNPDKTFAVRHTKEGILRIVEKYLPLNQPRVIKAISEAKKSIDAKKNQSGVDG
jgi:hypothetical protein